MVFSWAWGKLIHEKNQKQKISWHCSFNPIVCHRCRWHRWQICRRCRFTPITDRGWGKRHRRWNIPHPPPGGKFATGINNTSETGGKISSWSGALAAGSNMWAGAGRPAWRETHCACLGGGRGGPAGWLAAGHVSRWALLEPPPLSRLGGGRLPPPVRSPSPPVWRRAGLPPMSLIPVANLELRISPRIFEKNRNGPNGILRALGETDSWKNQKQKISWHCPFKPTFAQREQGG